jgi:hypothetical protein
LVAVTRLTRAYRSFHIGFAGEELLAVLLPGVDIGFYRVLFFPLRLLFPSRSFIPFSVYGLMRETKKIDRVEPPLAATLL